MNDNVPLTPNDFLFEVSLQLMNIVMTLKTMVSFSRVDQADGKKNGSLIKNGGFPTSNTPRAVGNSARSV